jgi:hypothetical protein
MDALFGEIDYVEAREAEASNEAIETTAYSSAKAGSEVKEKIMIEHVDAVEENKKSSEKSV